MKSVLNFEKKNSFKFSKKLKFKKKSFKNFIDLI